MTAIEVREADAGRPVCARCTVADDPFTRLRGLMGRRTFPQGDGLLIEPAPSIHTCFMRFAIDAVFLDADMTVLAIRSHLRPWRLAGARGARAVLELPAGEAERAGLREGARLQRHDAAPGARASAEVRRAV